MPLETLILSSQVCCTKEGGEFSYSQKNIQISSYSRVSLKPIIPSTSSKLDHRIPLSPTTGIGSNSHFLLFHIRLSRHSSQKNCLQVIHSPSLSESFEKQELSKSSQNNTHFFSFNRVLSFYYLLSLYYQSFVTISFSHLMFQCIILPQNR